MITANLKGGLGNQMFQYARARAAAGKRPIRLNIYELEHPAPGDTPRAFALDVFALGPHEIARQAPSWKTRLGRRIRRRWQPDWGYFQSEDYFASAADLIRREFTLRTPSPAFRAFEERIGQAEQPVSLHIRRGDYAKNPRVLQEFGLCSPAYYDRAISHILGAAGAADCFVFSDDLPWAKAHLPLPDQAVYVDDKALSAAEELALMSRCRHHIIANSSFSWWGAWLDLSPQKIVVAPAPWFDRAPYNRRLIPDSWTQLPKN